MTATSLWWHWRVVVTSHRIPVSLSMVLLTGTWYYFTLAHFLASSTVLNYWSSLRILVTLTRKGNISMSSRKPTIGHTSGYLVLLAPPFFLHCHAFVYWLFFLRSFGIISIGISIACSSLSILTASICFYGRAAFLKLVFLANDSRQCHRVPPRLQLYRFWIPVLTQIHSCNYPLSSRSYLAQDTFLS